MNLSTWIKFNKESNLTKCDLIIVGVKKSSCDNKYPIFSVGLPMDRANQLFGNFEIRSVGAGKYPDTDYCGVSVLIEIPDIEETT